MVRVVVRMRIDSLADPTRRGAPPGADRRRPQWTPLAWAFALAIAAGVGCAVPASAAAAAAVPTPPRADDVGTPVPAPPTPPGAPSEDIYRRLFETQLALSRARQQAVRDSLAQERERLLAILRGLRSEQRRALADTARERRELERLTEELQHLAPRGEDVDWELIGKRLDESLGGLERGLDQLGQRLGDLELEIGPERVRVGDRRTGDRLVFAIPPELRESIKDGIRAVQEELNVTLSDSLAESADSAGSSARSEWRHGLSQVAPLRELFRNRAEAKRKIVKGPVVKVRQSYVVAPNETVQGDVIVVLGDLDVQGRVLGNAIVMLGDLSLAEGSSVRKDVVHVGGAMVTEGEPTVEGAIYDIGHRWPGLAMPGLFGDARSPWIFVVYAVRLMLVVLLLVLALGLMGDRMAVMAQRLEVSPLQAILRGGVWFIIYLLSFVIASAALAVTIIGIPVVVVLVVAFLALLAAAYFVTCQVLGARLLRALRGIERPAPWPAALTGLALLELPGLMGLVVGLVPALGQTAMLLRFFDFALKLLALCIGFGAVVSTRGGDRRRAVVRPAAGVASPETAPSAG